MRSVRCVLTAALALALSVCLLSPARADFSDVPKEHWAHAVIRRAEEAGAVNGVGGGLFDPENSVTEAQFYAMLLRTLSGVSVEDYGPGVHWYDPYMAAAADTGLSDGVYASSPDAPLTRCQMAQVMFNLVRGPRDEKNAEGVLSSIPDGDAVPQTYRFAVAFAYSAGLIRGMNDAGAFMGDQPMTRAQAAAVWCRLADYLEEFGVNDEVPAEAEPEEALLGKAMTVNGAEYRTGMTEEALTALAGEPDEILEAFGDYRWYVFGTEDYTARFFAAGVRDGRVVLLLSAGKSFSMDCMGEAKTWGSAAGSAPSDLPYGEDAGTVTEEGSVDDAVFYHDKHDGYILYMALAAEKGSARVPYYAMSFSPSEEECAGEARMLLHLVNAARAAYGIRPMIWDPAAAEAALLHAKDMTLGNYFGHESADGRSAGDRLRNAGIPWSACGENIANGYWGAMEVHAGWMASASHRSNLLKEEYTRFGAGIAFSGKNVNSVEDFYAMRDE